MSTLTHMLIWFGSTLAAAIGLCLTVPRHERADWIIWALCSYGSVLVLAVGAVSLGWWRL